MMFPIVGVQKSPTFYLHNSDICKILLNFYFTKYNFFCYNKQGNLHSDARNVLAIDYMV